MKILFINACARTNSRTMVLAQEVLKNLEGDIKELKLFDMDLKPLDEERISTRLTEPKHQVLAKEFAESEIILIAAPIWDMSFPAILKIYIENITITGITFKYTSDGPMGLCKAKQVYYVSTCGGNYVMDFGFNYVKTLFSVMFGIKNFTLFTADKLDMRGSNVSGILEETIEEIDTYFNNDKE